MSLIGAAIGGLASGAAGALLGGKDKAPQPTTTTNSSWIQGMLNQNVGGLVDGLMGGNTPTMGSVNTGGYLQGMGNLMGDQYQQYQDMISNKGQGDRYQNLLNMQEASAKIAGDQLAQTNMGIQSAAGAQGQAGSSRQGIAQGLATSDAQAKLNLQQAQMNQDFLNSEQAMKQAGMAGMQNLYNQVGQMMGAAQQGSQFDYMAQMKNNPYLSKLMMLQMGLLPFADTQVTATQK